MPLTAPSFESCCVAFLGVRRVASGNLREMVPAVLEALAADPHAPLAVFDDEAAAKRYAAAVSLDIAAAGITPGSTTWYGACRVDLSTRVFVEHIAANPEFVARVVAP